MYGNEDGFGLKRRFPSSLLLSPLNSLCEVQPCEAERARRCADQRPRKHVADVVPIVVDSRGGDIPREGERYEENEEIEHVLGEGTQGIVFPDDVDGEF